LRKIAYSITHSITQLI